MGDHDDDNALLSGLLKKGTKEGWSVQTNTQTPRSTSSQIGDGNGQVAIDSHLGSEGLGATVGQA